MMDDAPRPALTIDVGKTVFAHRQDIHGYGIFRIENVYDGTGQLLDPRDIYPGDTLSVVPLIGGEYQFFAIKRADFGDGMYTIEIERTREKSAMTLDGQSR